MTDEGRYNIWPNIPIVLVPKTRFLNVEISLILAALLVPV
jgi:hypothetical protein